MCTLHIAARFYAKIIPLFFSFMSHSYLHQAICGYQTRHCKINWTTMCQNPGTKHPSPLIPWKLVTCTLLFQKKKNYVSDVCVLYFIEIEDLTSQLTLIYLSCGCCLRLGRRQGSMWLLPGRGGWLRLCWLRLGRLRLCLVTNLRGYEVTWYLVNWLDGN